MSSKIISQRQHKIGMYERRRLGIKETDIGVPLESPPACAEIEFLVYLGLFRHQGSAHDNVCWFSSTCIVGVLSKYKHQRVH